ncbi:SDR family NAD(P)-dependent oxidoreductase [Sediminitomix flava]|uniref:NAD(P)-dependent dehydrogenase (Short-subunit alcohol dehydrogenase family) n=1 Tax=Sediminitomix flava TaxID=379075 RepID=A0A315ZET4_SEDFL|nr:SDR family NAD(P)-dependent oxidoreductase [Sediminitomix flava]PWJ44106.1 NAD(P)-dependent dehydrogenase (short-subunit alcohol dehydrogenase family) [Sediminitomix flava]
MSNKRVVFITGCSSGIGYGLTKHYLEEGAEVYALSRRQPDEFTSFSNFHFKSIDLNDLEGVSLQLKSLLENVNQIDLAVLNAGIIGEIKDMVDTSISEIRNVMDVNVWANKLILDELLNSERALKQVVAISSGASVNGNRGWSAYSLSKASLNMLIKLYAAEHPEVQFNSFAPGLVDTAMQDYLCGDELDEEKFPSAKRLKAARNTPTMPKPAEAAQVFDKAFSSLFKYDSGEYVDVRKMGE